MSGLPATAEALRVALNEADDALRALEKENVRLIDENRELAEENLRLKDAKKTDGGA